MNFYMQQRRVRGGAASNNKEKRIAKKGELFDIEQIIIIMMITIIILCKRFSFSISIRTIKKFYAFVHIFVCRLSIVFVFFVYEIWFVEREKWLNWYDFCCISFFSLLLLLCYSLINLCTIFSCCTPFFADFILNVHTISICSWRKINFLWNKSATKIPQNERIY